MSRSIASTILIRLSVRGIAIAAAALVACGAPPQSAAPSPSASVPVTAAPTVVPEPTPTPTPVPTAAPTPVPERTNAPYITAPLTDAQKAALVYSREVLLAWPALPPNVTWYEDPNLTTGTAFTLYDGTRFAVALRKGGSQIQAQRDFTVWHESGHVLASVLGHTGVDTNKLYLAYAKARGLPAFNVVTGPHAVLTAEQFADDFALSNLGDDTHIGSAEQTYFLPLDRVKMLAFYRSLFTPQSPVQTGPTAAPFLVPLTVPLVTPLPAVQRTPLPTPSPERN